MNKTGKLLIALFSSTMLAGVLSGCGSNQVYERPPYPPQVQGTDADDWEWDEETGEWYYEEDDLYWYNGGVHKKSILHSGLKSTAKLKSSLFSTKAGSFGKASGFGSSFHGGG